MCLQTPLEDITCGIFKYVGLEKINIFKFNNP
jgi:hypothetical protein